MESNKKKGFSFGYKFSFTRKEKYSWAWSLFSSKFYILQETKKN